MIQKLTAARSGRTSLVVCLAILAPLLTGEAIAEGDVSFAFNVRMPTDATTQIACVKVIRYSVTITSIDCIVDPADTGEDIQITVMECDTQADNCAHVETVLLCDNTGDTDNGVIDAPAIEQDNYICLSTGTMTGTPELLVVTLGAEK